jgi:hypothetical protein
MALWNTFHWSDGTLWADANGVSNMFTSAIDRSGYHVSLSITHATAAYPGSLASFVLQSVSAELGVRAQLPTGHEAFIDRNENAQRISVAIRHTANPAIDLLTEAGENITTEAGDNLAADPAQPFVIDQIHGLINSRSKRQPTT